jgi:hypothetical protein
MTIGTTIGSCIPYLWGSYFSFSSIFLSAAGGVLGIWGGYALAKYTGA